MLKYAMTLRTGWTHVLKTDDDCYVRMQNIIRAIQVTNAICLCSAVSFAGR